MSIAVSNITKQYGEQKALDSVSFQVSKGEIVGLLGPNGAGKTTTMKILSGFISKFDGEAFVDGLSVREEPLVLKQRIGYLPEHNPLYLDMYVREYLDFIATVYKIQQRSEEIDRVVNQVGLGIEQHKKISALSKGYRQRIGLAQALIHDPKVLILDEPTSGLDPNQLVEIRHLIKTIGQEKTVIFSSHIMQEVQALCDRVIILSKGKVVADDQVELLDRALNNQREIIIELNRDFQHKWKVPALVQSQVLAPNKYKLLFKKSAGDPRENIFDFVVEKGAKILSMEEKKSTVEDVFQKLTGQ